MDSEPVEKADGVLGESDGDGHVREGVFEDEIPADDPCHQLAECGVGVGVGRAGDGDHGGQLCVAEAGEGADDGNENERKRERWAGSGAADECGVVNDVVQNGSVQDGGCVELFAGDRRADDGKDAGADDGSYAKGCERNRPQRLFEAVLRIFRLADELVDRFTA